jgi:hypothetical protein
VKNLRLFLAAGLLAGAVLAMPLSRAAAQDRQGAVFVMTNAASNNQVNTYTRQTVLLRP